MIARLKTKPAATSAAVLSLHHLTLSVVLLQLLSSASSSAFITAPIIPPLNKPRLLYAKDIIRLSQSASPKQPNAVDEATTTTTTTTDKDTTPTTTTFQIREAQYSDLAQAADLMTDGFYPELRNNPIMRPIRYVLELDRLQNNFPYDRDGRHYYLVVNEIGDGMTNRNVIGFCDIDGRIPTVAAAQTNSTDSVSTLLSQFTKRIIRPQPYFSDLAIDPNYRRQGIASALMKEAESRATNMGFEELYLGVRSTNELALNMYSNIGYESIIPQGEMVDFLAIQKGVSLLRRSLTDGSC